MAKRHTGEYIFGAQSLARTRGLEVGVEEGGRGERCWARGWGLDSAKPAWRAPALAAGDVLDRDRIMIQLGERENQRARPTVQGSARAWLQHRFPSTLIRLDDQQQAQPLVIISSCF